MYKSLKDIVDRIMEDTTTANLDKGTQFTDTSDFLKDVSSKKKKKSSDSESDSEQKDN